MEPLELKIERHISAPGRRVWEVVTNLADAPDVIEAIRKIEILTDGPVGLGTQFAETRMIMRRETTETMEIIAWDPPLSYVVGGESCGTRFETEVRCTPDGEAATMLSMTIRTTPLTFFSRLMRPLAKLMMGSMRKMIGKDLDDISRACVGGGEEEVGD